MKDYIVVDSITKSFSISKKQMKRQGLKNNQITAVNDLSFSISKGEILGVLGSNGAGKTTTLRMLAGMITPDKGQIFFEGERICKHNRTYKKRIGFLTNELKYDGFFTTDYLFHFFSKLYGLNDSEINSRREYLFSKFQISGYSHLKICELSTGMKQKVSLALSLAHNPDIIIYDEPTNGLDILAAKTVEDLLLDLKNEGKTIILSSHILNLVEKLCDRVLLIKDGRLINTDNIYNICASQSLDDYFFSKYEKGVTP